LLRADSIGSRNDKRETSSAMTHKKIEILRSAQNDSKRQG